MNYLQRLHVLFVSTLSMIVVWVGILGWAEVARGQASYEELHAFALVGTYPYAGLIQDSAGNLYGTTMNGGVSGVGTVYKLAPNGALTVLHTFDYSSYGYGAYTPFAGLIQDSAGNLYGTTYLGGASGGGVVFAIQENHPPVANAGPDQLVTAEANCQATVVLDGTGSSDPDDDALTFTWSGPFGTASGPTPTVSLPVGTHTITLTVRDSYGGAASDTVVVVVDEGVQTTFYRDADGDGYGNPTSAAQACTAPAGYVTTNTDCNDSAVTIHPEATELCNGMDDNCNGTVDEGFDVGASCTAGAGDCQGTGTKVCTADGQGTQCNATPKADGSACNDGDACTQSDTCQAGSCTGSNPVTCSASDQCHVAGTCDPSSGQCSNPAAVNGTACTDSNACTQTDTCQSGSCTGSNPVTCSASDQCHVAGTCDPKPRCMRLAQ